MSATTAPFLSSSALTISLGFCQVSRSARSKLAIRSCSGLASEGGGTEVCCAGAKAANKRISSASLPMHRLPLMASSIKVDNWTESLLLFTTFPIQRASALAQDSLHVGASHMERGELGPNFSQAHPPGCDLVTCTATELLEVSRLSLLLSGAILFPHVDDDVHGRQQGDAALKVFTDLFPSLRESELSALAQCVAAVA